MKTFRQTVQKTRVKPRSFPDWTRSPVFTPICSSKLRPKKIFSTKDLESRIRHNCWFDNWYRYFCWCCCYIFCSEKRRKKERIVYHCALKWSAIATPFIVSKQYERTDALQVTFAFTWSSLDKEESLWLAR